jgi:hypothetical protein
MSLTDKRIRAIEKLLHQPYLSAWAISYWNNVKIKLLKRRQFDR